MIRDEGNGKLSCYIAKKDQEEAVTSLEFNQPDKWGGKIDLADGSSWKIEPLDKAPKLPITLRARRA
nr:putative nitrogen fixation protein NifT [Echinimonas agarilytica]